MKIIQTSEEKKNKLNMHSYKIYIDQLQIKLYSSAIALNSLHLTHVIGMFMFECC